MADRAEELADKISQQMAFYGAWSPHESNQQDCQAKIVKLCHKALARERKIISSKLRRRAAAARQKESKT